MNDVALWSAAAATATSGLAFGLAHWRDRQRIAALRRDLQRLEQARQDHLRMSTQTRKQIDDLQKTVAEYRRRLAAQDAARRSRETLAAVVADPVPEPAMAEAEAPPVRPGGWADTQPM